MVHYCAMKKCYNSSKDARMHKFSQKKGVYEKWLKALDRPELYTKTLKQLSNYYVCDRHFAPSTKTNKTTKTNLIPGSVPTLFLKTTPPDVVEDDPPQTSTDVVHVAHSELAEGVDDPSSAIDHTDASTVSVVETAVCLDHTYSAIQQSTNAVEVPSAVLAVNTDDLYAAMDQLPSSTEVVLPSAEHPYMVKDQPPASTDFLQPPSANFAIHIDHSFSHDPCLSTVAELVVPSESNENHPHDHKELSQTKDKCLKVVTTVNLNRKRKHSSLAEMLNSHAQDLQRIATLLNAHNK